MQIYSVYGEIDRLKCNVSNVKKQSAPHNRALSSRARAKIVRDKLIICWA